MELSKKKFDVYLVYKIIAILIIISVFIVVNLMINYKRNQFYGDYGSKNEFVKTIDCSDIFDKNQGSGFLLRFDAKSERPGVVKVYLQNGDSTRYYFEEKIDLKDTYQTYELEVHPELVDASVKESYLSFFGGYGSGVITNVKNLEVIALSMSIEN